MKKLVPLSWYGGKATHLKWLLPIIEGMPHHTYCETHGGGGTVLLNKKQSPVEVYNDIYGEVVSFFKALRDNKDELLSLLSLTPYSREEFADACLNEATSPTEKARQFFVKARQIRLGLVTTASPGRWAYGTKDSRRGMALPVSRWLSAIDSLEEVCLRLKQVQIENLDGLDVIGRYDSEKTLFYVDPPYPMESRTGGVAYAHEYDTEKHLALLELLKSVKGKVVLSGYANETYDSVLAGWEQRKADAKIAWSTLRNGKSGVRQEIVWIKN